MKNNTLKKILIGAAALTVSSSLIAGCGSTSSDNEAASESEVSADETKSSGTFDEDNDPDIEDEDESVSDDEEKEEESDEKTDRSSGRSGKDKMTLMVYMVGSNLESEMGSATLDLQEMALSGYDQDEMNVVVCAGGAQQWQNTSVDGDDLRVYVMEGDDIVPVSKMKNDNMSDPETLTEFIDIASESYPADRYSLILWNHGGGAVVGYGADEKYGNTMMSVSGIGKALDDTDFSRNEKFEWIGFDACMMSMIEVADTLKDYADYMVASEEVEAQDGWDYSMLKDITDEDAYDGEDAGEIITKAYGDYYEDAYSFTPDYTLSCLDMSKVSGVMDAMSDFAKEAEEALVDGDYSKLARARDNTKAFGEKGTEGTYDYIDLGSLAGELSYYYPEYGKELKAAVKDCVVCNVTNIGRASGVSAYFPFDNKAYMDEMVMLYDQEEYNSEYSGFIHDFVNVLNGEPLTDWDIEKRAPSKKTADDNAYSVTLSADEIANYSQGYSSIWEPDAYDGTGESYIFWLESSNTSLDENGNLSTDFDGRIFYLTDASGDKVPIFAIQTDGDGTYSEYATTVMKGSLMDADTYNVDIYFRVDEEHPTGVITGVYRHSDTYEASYADKKVDTLSDGDHLSILYFARKIGFNDDGSLKPFADWEKTSFLGAGMDVEGELSVVYEKPELAHDYVGLFNICDTQGERHFTDYIDIQTDGKENSGTTVYEEQLGEVDPE